MDRIGPVGRFGENIHEALSARTTLGKSLTLSPSITQLAQIQRRVALKICCNILERSNKYY